MFLVLLVQVDKLILRFSHGQGSHRGDSVQLLSIDSLSTTVISLLKISVLNRGPPVI